jgi:hypothetical protein
MKYGENECTPQGTRIYCREVTSRYRNGLRTFLAGLNGIRNRFVTKIENRKKINPGDLSTSLLQELT